MIHVRIMNGHEGFGLCEGLEAKLRVEAVSVLRGQQETAEALEIRVRHDRLHDELGDAPASMSGDDKDVGNIGEGSVIGDDPGEADLLRTIKSTEGK